MLIIKKKQVNKVRSREKTNSFPCSGGMSALMSKVSNTTTLCNDMLTLSHRFIGLVQKCGGWGRRCHLCVGSSVLYSVQVRQNKILNAEICSSRSFHIFSGTFFLTSIMCFFTQTLSCAFVQQH